MLKRTSNLLDQGELNGGLTPPARRKVDRGTRGGILPLVLVVVAVLTLAVTTFANFATMNYRAANVQGKIVQAGALVESGAELLKQLLALDPATRRDAGGLYHNPARLQGVLVVDDAVAADRGRFTVIAPQSQANGGGARFGLENESTRLNLNILVAMEKQQEGGGRALLMALPGMTEDVADAILDWLDADDEPRQYGAERDYYSGMSPAYAPRNGAPASLDELLLVRGVTPALLYGPDTNRNCQIDRGETNAATAAGIDDPDGDFLRGWAGLLTLHSAENNLRVDGTARIDLNGDDLQKLHTDLQAVVSADQATFIIAYRQFGPTAGAEQGRAIDATMLDLKRQGSIKFASVLDLIGVSLRVTPTGTNQPVVIEPAFPAASTAMSDYLPKLLDNVTTNSAKTIPGRININQAAAAIIRGIPGISPEAAQKILDLREPEAADDQPQRAYPTWLLVEGLVTLDEMKTLYPFITAGGDVWRGQIVGFFEGIGPSARAEVLLDATGSAPRLVSWKELTPLGRGFAWETLGVSPAQ